MRLVPDHRTPGPSNSSPSTTYKPITGHCYCGAIEWQLVGKVAFTANCHCKTCQCLAGSAYGSTSLMVYDDKGIEFTRGQPKVFHDTADSGNPTQRGFCSTCGTVLFNHVSEGRKDQHWAMRTGSIVGIPAASPMMDKEIFMKSKPAWVPSVQSPGNQYEGMPDD
ncbi:MAG: hypothetical protein MMC33_003136 [Icmadophila ericetorum]|nr:hypothetical protein [Icmadophila ericetorum]